MCQSKSVGLKKLSQIGYSLEKLYAISNKKVCCSLRIVIKKKHNVEGPDMPVINTYRQRSITQQTGLWNEKLNRNIQIFNKN